MPRIGLLKPFANTYTLNTGTSQDLCFGNSKAALNANAVVFAA
jgi:hypothetical protein